MKLCNCNDKTIPSFHAKGYHKGKDNMKTKTYEEMWRLAISAPELLEACKLSAQVIDKMLDGAICDADDKRMIALEALDKAIAKAEGRA